MKLKSVYAGFLPFKKVVYGIGILIFFGCASPIPVSYFPTLQIRMQATRHWDFLADDVANQIKQTLEGAGFDSQQRVHVELEETTPFGKTFSELLITHLVQKGVKVSRERNESAIFVENSVQVIRHRSQRFVIDMWGNNSAYSALSDDIFVLRGNDDKTSGTTTFTSESVEKGLPHTEVVITSTIVKNNDYIMRNSEIYYVNDPDFWHYQNVEPKMPENTVREFPVKG